MEFDEVARGLADAGRRFDAREWVLGTSGNFSAVVSRDPLRLAITPSAVFKGELDPRQILEIDERAAVTNGRHGKPSAEAQLHLEVVRARGAGAVLHTHSLWSTLVSEQHAAEGGVSIQGFEMLKGLAGVGTHEHREWIPVLENAQDMTALAADVNRVLAAHPSCHAVLLRRHGMYTWGETLRDGVRHVEIMEFLLEALGRTKQV